MKFPVRSVLALGLAALVIAPLFAQDAQKGKGKGNRPGARDAFALPRSITLSDDQKSKLEDIKKKYEGKLAEIRKKGELTKEQQDARAKAMEEAKSAGKKGRELFQAAQGAVNLTDDQKKAQADLASVSKEIQDAIKGILTDEQKAALESAGKKRKGKKNEA
jgi:Spy/CpxP family protein refolding chaperone